MFDRMTSYYQVRTNANTTSRPVAALALAALIGSLVFTVPPMFFPQIAADLDVSAASLGVTSTVLLLVGTFVALVAGPIADRLGYRPLLIFGAIAAGGYLLGFGMALDRIWLLPAAALGGVAFAILPNISAAAAGSLPTESSRQRALGWTSAGGAFAVVVGVPLLALLVNVAGWRVAFAAAAIGALSVALILRVQMQSSLVRESGKRSSCGYRSLLRDRHMKKIFISSSFRAISWFGMLTYLGAFLGDRFDAGAGAAAAVYMSGGLAYIAGSLLSSSLSQRLAPISIIGATNLGMAAVVSILFIASGHVLIALTLVALSGLLGGLSWVAMTTILNAQTPVGRATTMSLNGVLGNGAGALGGALGGAVLAFADYQVLGVVLAIPAILAFATIQWPATSFTAFPHRPQQSAALS